MALKRSSVRFRLAPPNFLMKSNGYNESDSADVSNEKL